MDAAEAINALEVTLRGLVRAVRGDSWLEGHDELRATLEQRRTEEGKRRDGTVVEHDLLAYTHIYEIRKIITKSWESFLPALKDRKRFDAYLDRIEDFRNVPMHSRVLLPFEHALLEGISGEFRNLVTIYRSSLGPDGKHYPVAESIIDSFGNQFDPSGSPVFTNLRLEVGDEVQFRCTGWDPQDRELTWTLSDGVGRDLDSSSGSAVTLRWVVTEGSVGENAEVIIRMRSSGKYHRGLSGDGFFQFRYAVNPPSS